MTQSMDPSSQAYIYSDTNIQNTIAGLGNVEMVDFSRGRDDPEPYDVRANSHIWRIEPTAHGIIQQAENLCSPSAVCYYQINTVTRPP